MRTHRPPERLNKWLPDTPDTCVTGLTEKNNLIHCVWKCSSSIALYFRFMSVSFSITSECKTKITLRLLQARRMDPLSRRDIEESSRPSGIELIAKSVTSQRLIVKDFHERI